MYVPEHFDIRELVWPGFFEANRNYGRRLFLALDARALACLDALRRRYGPVTVNDWHLGGAFRLSGLRPMGSGTGARLSQHIFGRAFDCKFRDVTADEVRADLLAWQAAGRPRGAGADIRNRTRAEAFAPICRIEQVPDMSWFHFDVGNHDPERDGVLVVEG